MSDCAVLRCLRHVLGLALVVLVWSIPAYAQDVPYVELSAGYNFMRNQPFVLAQGGSQGGVNGPKGLYGDVAVNLNHAIGVVGLMTNNDFNGDNVFTGMGGLRFSARGFARGPGRAVPFFQILGGLMRTQFDDATFIDKSMQLGGGANITFTDHAAVRAEADFIRTVHQENSAEGDNYIRFSIGVTYGFGAH
jgi:hypothetical protein